MTDLVMHNCECCNAEPGVGVASIPGIPVSIMWGRKCLEAGIIPYWAAVANTACCDGLDNTHEGWQDLVKATLEYFGRTLEQFTADVQAELDREAEEMARADEDGS